MNQEAAGAPREHSRISASGILRTRRGARGGIEAGGIARIDGPGKNSLIAASELVRCEWGLTAIIAAEVGQKRY